MTLLVSYCTCRGKHVYTYNIARLWHGYLWCLTSGIRWWVCRECRSGDRGLVIKLGLLGPGSVRWRRSAGDATWKGMITAKVKNLVLHIYWCTVMYSFTTRRRHKRNFLGPSPIHYLSRGGRSLAGQTYFRFWLYSPAIKNLISTHHGRIIDY